MTRGARSPTVDIAATGTIVLLWTFALWASWMFKGLYADGSDVLLEMVGIQWFTGGPFDPRAHAILLTEAPTVLAMKLGVRDLRWLARIYSFGLYAVPAALYSLALLRARRDAVALATTIASLAIVFMTTSFHIGSESHTAYGTAILAAVWLVTAPRLINLDGAVLVLLAAFGSRVYEHSVYLGPLLALMTIWTMARAPARPPIAATLYGAAAALFIFGMIVAARSLHDFETSEIDRGYLETTIGMFWAFRFNVQLDLLAGAAALLLAWGICRPDHLARPWPYLAAGLLALLVTLSPLLVFVERLVSPPYSWTQYASRTVAGPIAAGEMLFLWFHASRHGAALPALAALQQSPAARNAVLLASAMFLATLPWNAMLTILYARYLDVVREVVRSRGGVTDSDHTLLALHPRLAHHDFAISSLSLIVRGSPDDGIVVLPPGLSSKNTIDPANPPDLGSFRWRDPP